VNWWSRLGPRRFRPWKGPLVPIVQGAKVDPMAGLDGAEPSISFDVLRHWLL
jgi:hypothetical protein